MSGLTSSKSKSIGGTDTSQTTAPIGWALGPLSSITQIAGDQYWQNPGGIDPLTAQARSRAQSIAQGGNPLATSNYNWASGLSATGGLTPEQSGLLKGYDGLLKSLSGPTAAKTYLTSMADGSQIGQNNPYINAIMDANASRIADRTASSMSGTGRYGSFAHGDALARSISEANNPLAAQAYESDRNRQIQAAGLIDSSDLARVAGQSGLLQSAFNGRQQGVANMGALASMAPSIDQQRYANSAMLERIGAANQAAPQQALQNWLNTVRGASNGYSQVDGSGVQIQNTTNTQSPMQSIAGGIQMLAGLGGGGGGKGGGKGVGSSTGGGLALTPGSGGLY